MALAPGRDAEQMAECVVRHTRIPELKILVMAGLDPATQQTARQREENFGGNESTARTDVRTLGGRVKPGHDDEGRINAFWSLARVHSAASVPFARR